MGMEPFDEFDQFLDWPTKSSFVPAVDIYQDETNIYVESPLAGIDPENIKITIENEILTIEGDVQKTSEVDEKNYYRKEVRSGSFHRSVVLPTQVDKEKIEAEFEKGILKIVLPKEEELKSNLIEIKVKNKK